MNTRLLNSVLLSMAMLTIAPANAFDLSDTPYQLVGIEKGLDPLLLYSVSLAESAYGIGEKGKIAPHAWTLRASKAHYSKTKDEAEATLQSYIDAGTTLVDIGLMQVNLRWHGQRVTNPSDLLDPITNVRVAADILSEAINSAKGDITLGIGRYHHWGDEDRARNYGERVLAIYRNLQVMAQGAAQ